MDLIVAFCLFIGAMAACLALNISILFALLLGLGCFLLLAHRHGLAWRTLPGLVWRGMRTALPVVVVMLCIGCLTALWRASGTIAFCVYHGLRLVSPRAFLLVAYLLPLALSFLLGTSFGVCGTAGVVVMALARSGGADPLMAAGAVLAGAYFGDRCSPSSSAGMLVSTVCGVDHGDCVKLLIKTGLLPALLSLAVFALLSLSHPLRQVDLSATEAMADHFRLSWLCLLPALVLLILPWSKLPIFYSLALSALVALVLALVLQGESLGSLLVSCLAGWRLPAGDPLAATLSGGGIVSMVKSCGVVLLSNSYSGLFREARLLAGVERRLTRLAERVGLFPTQILSALLCAGIFCNQAIGTVLGSQILGGVYKKRGASRMELAGDLGSSILTIAGLIPWSVASSVPLAMLGAGPGALVYAVFLYAVPLCYLATKRIWFKRPKAPAAACGLNEY